LQNRLTRWETTRLENGDWLVIFTDGIVEAEDGKQDEYGEQEFDPPSGSRIGLGASGDAEQDVGGVGPIPWATRRSTTI